MLKGRILPVVLMGVILLLAALPAFASHQWNQYDNIACDAATQTLSFTAVNAGGGSPGLWVDVQVNGAPVLTSYELWSDITPITAGQHSFSITNAAFVAGASVRLISDYVDTTVTCAGTSAPVSICLMPRPDGFVIRSIPAGAYAYYQPNADTFAGFVLPAGTWYSKITDDLLYYQVWIACDGDMIFVPAASVVP